MPDEPKQGSANTLIWVSICIIVLAWYFRADIATFTASLSSPAYELTAKELMDAYVADEVAADLKYQDKVVVVSGKVVGKSKSLMGDIYVNLSAVRFLTGIQCVFAERYAREVAAIRTGYDVRIKGRVKGKLGNVVLRGCRVQGARSR